LALSGIGFELGLIGFVFSPRQAGKISHLLVLKELMSILMFLKLGLFCIQAGAIFVLFPLINQPF